MGKGNDPQVGAAMIYPVAGTLTDVERRTLQTYENSGSAWAAARDDGHGFWQAEYDRYATMLPGDDVLDIGSGNGRDARLLTEHGRNVTGCDISPALLDIAARACPQATFVPGSVYELPFADESFHGVWAAAILLHLPKDRVQAGVQEMARVLRPSGAAFVAVKLGTGEQLQDGPLGERFFAYYQPVELARLLHDGGLNVADVVVRDLPGGPWVCAWATRP